MTTAVSPTPKPRSSPSRPALQRALTVSLVVLAGCAAAVLFLVPSSRSVAIIDIQSLAPGPLATQDVVFSYYPNASVEVRANESGTRGNVLVCRLTPSERWTGFGMVTGAASPRDATLFLRWRCSGTAPQIQIDLQERGAGAEAPAGEVFSAIVPFVYGQWVTTPLPLKNFVRNENYQPAGAVRNGVLDTDRLGSLDFTLPPDSDMTIEIADMRISWPSAKWPVFGGLAFGVLALLVIQVSLLSRRRVSVERSLEVSEANYQAIFDAVREGILVLDPATGVALDVNRTACEMLGKRRESLLGRRFTDLASEALGEDVTLPLRGGAPEPGGVWERMVRMPDGRAFWIEVRATEATIGANRRVLLVARDVTAMREAEAERLRLEQHLLQSQKMEALGHLAGGVAHDFNNILTGITLATEVAQLRVGDVAAVRAGLGQVRGLATRASDLTRQMLTFSRRHPVRSVPIRLNAVVGEALSMLRRLIGEDINLTFTAGTDRDVINGDRSQIEQMLVNLVVNGRDAMAAGGDLTISTRSAPGGGDPAGLPGGEQVVLEVTDTGHGMDEETRRRIFEPFFTTKAVGKGTGLGLAMVYGIVARHGATISVETSPDQGSTFRIAFPQLDVDEASAADAAPAVAEVPQGTEMILVVEDDMEVRKLLEVTLDGLGYRTLSADCPARAETIYRERRDDISLLLTDVVMPGESGPEFYRRIAREDPGLKVVFMSGYADARPGSENILRDGLPFIQKPFGPAELARLLRETLDARPRGAG
jgi:PAS domain S-box-containing protein